MITRLALNGPSGRAVLPGILVLCAALAAGCEDGEFDAARSAITTGTAAINESDQALLEKTIVPARPLVDPEGVYFTRIEETYPTAQTLPLYHTVHVFNPTAGGTVRMSVTAKTSTGATDFAHTFDNATITPIIDRLEGSPEGFPDASGQAVYTITGAAAGWYRLRFEYGAPNANRKMIFTADNGAAVPLKTAWMDPGGKTMQVRAVFTVESQRAVYLKGGAYRNTLPTMHAYADSITLDGRLLYRRSFDQEKFNYPLGVLSAGTHTLTFSLTNSGDLSAKFWFGVNETSFDLLGSKTTWDAAQFVYDGEMRTGDYDAWNEGIAFAQGSSLTPGVRPPPVRKGNIFTVALDHASLCGPWMNAILRIYPYGSGSETNWPTERPSTSDYTGGIYTASGFETHCRELWRVTVPANAKVGRYVLRAVAPNGVVVGGDVMFYVIHNPFSLLNNSLASPGQIASYGYDDDFDGVHMEFDEHLDLDVDADLDHFIAMYKYSSSSEFQQKTVFSGGFRRTGEPDDYAMLDYAVAAAEGTTTEFETMRRLYRMVSQRIYYGGSDASSDASLYIIGSDRFTPTEANIFAKPGTAVADDQQTQGICYSSAVVLASLARTCGLLSRAVLSLDQLGGWGDHGFTEVLIPDLPKHGGHIGPTAVYPISDTDHWMVFDATSPQGGLSDIPWTKYSEAVASRSQYGRASMVLSDPNPIYYKAVTNYPEWNPYLTDWDTTADVWDVTDDYVAGVEYWLTGSTSGWLGRGEKDVYRISKSATGAKAVRVRTLPHDGEFLVPKICVGSVANTPVMPEKCLNAGTHADLPAGESYVVVFNDSLNLRSLRGDSIEYLLELEY